MQARLLLSVIVLVAFVAQAALPGSASAQATCGPIDVAFVIDDTGSMGGTLESIQEEFVNTLAAVQAASRNDYRLALVTFKDDVNVREVFAPNNQATITPKIQALSASGGGGTPEASDEAVNMVVNALPAAGRAQNIDFTPAFRSGALKIVVLVTDAVPGGFDDTFQVGVDDVRVETIAGQALARGIRISSVFVPTDDDPIARTMTQRWATITGGLFVETADTGVGAGAALSDIVARCGGAGPTGTAAPEAKNDPNNDDEEDEARRRSRTRNNAARGEDEERTEGNVVGVRCVASDPVPTLERGFIVEPDVLPYAMIVNRDGAQKILLIRDAAKLCQSIRVGDYLEADGEKQSEELFYADEVDIKRRR